MIWSLLFLLVSQSSHALSIIEKPGVYKASGYLERDKQKYSFILEQGTATEIQVKLSDVDKNIARYEGTNIEVHMEIFKPCMYECSGKIKKVLKQYMPNEDLPPFVFPKPKPIK